MSIVKMSMSMKMSGENYHSHTRILFGVPLKEIYYPGKIHPGLWNLFEQSYENVISEKYSIDALLTYYQGSFDERLALKRKLSLSNKLTRYKAPPGTLLWVIRHFFGLLPTNLMAKRIGDQKFFWWKLTKECKSSLNNYITEGRYNQDLINKLSRELLRLPPANFSLLVILFDFLRKLAVLPAGEPQLNKTSVFALAKYFSSSIFIRPFRPGHVTKMDREYYPLTMYFILKWQDIRSIIVKTRWRAQTSLLKNSYNNKLWKYPKYASKTFRNNTTQTNSFDYKSKATEPAQRIIPQSYYDFDYLKDVACQTDVNFKNDNVFCCCILGQHIKNLIENQQTRSNYNCDKYSQTDEKKVVLNQKCCSAYSTNIGTKAHPRQFSSDADVDKPNLTQINSYDDGVESLDPIKKENSSSEKEELMTKIRKLGYSYTHATNNTVTPKRSPPNSESSLIPINCNIPCHDTVNEHSYDEYEKNEITSIRSYSTTTSSKKLSKTFSQRAKCLINVKRITSRLHLLKVFGNRNGKMRRGYSYEEVSSTIKYEKIDSTL